MRQPIGGDFAFSPQLIDYWKEQDVWQSDVGRFGIDIWMTTSAIVQNFNIGQARLGVKIHDVKDPGEHLGPMFRQVVDTMMELMEDNVESWMNIKGSEEVPILGEFSQEEPEPFTVDVDALVQKFKIGYRQFRSVWKNFIKEDNFEEIRRISKLSTRKFNFPADLWGRILSDYAVTFHAWEANRYKLTTLMTPLYYARIASFVNETKDMSNEEAEALIEADALKFEKIKKYLIKRWRNSIDEISWREPRKINT